MTIAKIWFDSEYLVITLDFGHEIGNPITWFPRLAKATLEQKLQ
jgi:hypothetical protein